MSAPQTPMRVMWYNLFDLSSISASEAATGLPASNVANQTLQQVWQSTDTGPVTLNVDMGPSLYGNGISCGILRNHNFTSSATVLLQSSPDNSTWTTRYTYTMTRTDANGQIVTVDPLVGYFSGVFNHRYWQWSITDGANTAGYVFVGRAFLGTYTQAAKRHQVNWKITTVDLSTTERSMNGVPQVNAKPVYRELDYSFSKVQVAQKDAFRAIYDSISTKTAAYYDMNPDSAAKDLYCIYGRAKSIPVWANDRWVLWSYPTKICEDL